MKLTIKKGFYAKGLALQCFSLCIVTKIKNSVVMPIINPRRACARVTVLVLSVCLCVCLSVCVCVFSLFWHLAQSGVQTAVSATSARYGHEILKRDFSLKRFVPKLWRRLLTSSSSGVVSGMLVPFFRRN